jgi:hypothetical protein
VTTRFHTDEHVSRSITVGLRQRGVDVLTVQEDGRTGASDAALLDRATELGRVLFSQDDDLLVEASERQKSGVPFAGVVYGHQLKLTIGQAIDDLELVARATGPEELLNAVLFLPL